MTDSDLISRARQGDEAAYDVLVQQHQEAVFRLAYLLLGDRGEADDVAQETFIHAFNALDRFDAARPIRPWLLRITTNLAHNRRRAIGRYISSLQRMIRMNPDALARTTTDEAARWESQALWQSVRRLNRTDQEVIYLRYFLELSEAEIAETLNVAPGTVKSRLHRAIGRLRTVVQRESPELWEERGK